MTKTSQQFVYLLIHTWAPVIDKQNWVMQKAYMSVLDDEIEQLTPRQFAQIFPITKEYKGRKYGNKDYYTVTDWISENIGWDNRIPNGIEFLMEYLNRDVQYAAVQVMHILDTFYQRRTGQDMLTAFFESQGIHVRRIDDWGQSDADDP